MMGGVSIYGMMSAEQRVFEQELDRKRRLHEAKRSRVNQEQGEVRRFGSIATSLRRMLGGQSRKPSPCGAELPAGC